VTSDDLTWTEQLKVTSDAGYGRLTVTGTTDFGRVMLGRRALQAVSLCNTGNYVLHVTRVAFLPPCPCDVIRRAPYPCRCRHGGTRDEAGIAVMTTPATPAVYGEATQLCDQCCLNFAIVTNPFPATLHPGSYLSVLLEYTPTCETAACCELVIESDDPENPRHIAFVTGRLRRTLRSALKCWLAQELHEILRASGG
jgi:hypothetical protein